MKKILIGTVVTIILLVVKPGLALADEGVVSASASLKKGAQTRDFRELVLEKYLKGHNSPLAFYAKDFIEYADHYNLDWRLVPAITGVESTFGKRIPQGSYNAYGWANGKYYFESWEDSIGTVSKTLREKYYDKGAVNIAQIARRYAPPSSTWGGKVKFFMRKIDRLPVSFSLST